MCVIDSFFPQFLEILWDEEIPLNWDVLYGGGAPTHSFAHVFSKACFDQCVTVNAAIDNCLKNRGRFGSSCGLRCSSQHGQEDMCDICGTRSSMCYVIDRNFLAPIVFATGFEYRQHCDHTCPHAVQGCNLDEMYTRPFPLFVFVTLYCRYARQGKTPIRVSRDNILRSTLEAFSR